MPNLPQIIQLVSGRAEFPAQVLLTPKSVLRKCFIDYFMEKLKIASRITRSCSVSLCALTAKVHGQSC